MASERVIDFEMIYQLIDCNFNIDSALVCNHRLLDYVKN